MSVNGVITESANGMSLGRRRAITIKFDLAPFEPFNRFNEIGLNKIQTSLGRERHLQNGSYGVNALC